MIILIATMSSEDFRFEKLTAENYHSWKFNMKMMLIGMDCWEIVEGTEILPADSTPKQQQEFRKRVNKSLSRICLGVSQKQIEFLSVKMSPADPEYCANFRRPKKLE